MTITLDDAVITESETLAEQRTAFLNDQLAAASETIEVLEESLAAVELAREDAGWRGVLVQGEMEFSREGLRTSARLCRTLAITNPLLKHGIELRTAYIWGSGVQVTARANGEDEGHQDVDSVVQAFLDDPETQRVLWGATARITNERTLATDGNLHCALWTNRATGKVRPRLIPFDQIDQVIKNPEDSMDRWFFQRTFVVQVAEPGTLPNTRRLRKETRRILYPSIDYRPASRPATYDGMPIEWDAPIVEFNVNGLDDWDFGIGDAFAVLPWVRAYADFLTDWAKIVKALSRFAFRTKNPSGRAARQAADAQRQAQRDPSLPAPRGSSSAGATANMGPGQELEAISKSGATIDANSGRPLGAMGAAGLGLPVTMFLADPGVSGARATAETLDFPTEQMANLRRGEWSDYLRRILGYVIDMAVRAPAGPLKGTMTRDRASGRLDTALAGDTPRTIEVVWPDLSEVPLKDLVQAIVEADATNKLPPLEVAKLLLHALGVDDVDEIVAQLTDEDGNWLDPLASAGDNANRRFRNGGDPPEDL